MPPADHGFALFGPAFGVPPGGFCASVFLVPRDGDRLLVGRMDRQHGERWTEAWQPNMAYYQGQRLDALFDGWRLPATYLREGEHPADAAHRVWADQLGYAVGCSLGPPTIVSHAGASRRAPGYQHWDLVFLYEADVEALPSPIPDHWASLELRPLEDLAPEGSVMLHGELLTQLA